MILSNFLSIFAIKFLFKCLFVAERKVRLGLILKTSFTARLNGFIRAEPLLASFVIIPASPSR